MQSAGGAAPVPTPEAAPTADVPATAAAGGDDEEAAATAALYRTWYPPVQRTLLLLSKLYRAVDAKIFSGLAQEAVAATTLSVQAAARTIMKVGRACCSHGAARVVGGFVVLPG